MEAKKQARPAGLGPLGRPAQPFFVAVQPPLFPRVSRGYLKTPPQGSRRDQFGRRRQGAEKIEGHLSESRGSC